MSRELHSEAYRREWAAKGYNIPEKRSDKDHATTASESLDAALEALDTPVEQVDGQIPLWEDERLPAPAVEDEEPPRPAFVTGFAVLIDHDGRTFTGNPDIFKEVTLLRPANSADMRAACRDVYDYQEGERLALRVVQMLSAQNSPQE